MHKKFSKSDITVRPFRTHKNWTIQSIDSSSVDSYGDSTYFEDKMTVNEGLNISGNFYPTGSSLYDSSVEPVNVSGEYKRNTYSAVDSLFYRNINNPMNQFGVEFVGEDPITKEKEIRLINDRVMVGRISRNYWGDKIVPGTIRLEDNSNQHESIVVRDDGFTNLYSSGSFFPTTDVLLPYNGETASYWVTGSGEFYYRENLVTYAQAQTIKNAGGLIDYVEGVGSWSASVSIPEYHSENERFGYSVSSWYKYVLVGSPTDTNTSAYVKNGRADVYKYDTNESRHRLIKTFRSPFISNRAGFTSSYQDGFGYAVSVRDDFVVIGSPTEDGCISEQSGSGMVYIYDKYKGGADHWGLINILEGSGSSDQFGASAAHDRGILAVGAPGADSNSGSVYIFRQKQYGSGSCMSIPTSSFWQKISSESGSCSIIVTESGSLFEVYGEEGAPYFVSGNFSWELETIITSSVADSQFGYSVSISDGRLLVGTHITSGSGYAVLFTASYTTDTCPTASWDLYKTFTSNEDYSDLDATHPFNFLEVPIYTDGFGYNVSIDGNHLAICSPYDKGFVPFIGAQVTQSLGAVYFYSFDTDTSCGIYDCALRDKTFGDRSVTLNNNFARSVSVSNGYASVGYSADKLSYTASFSGGNFDIENWQTYSTSSSDQSTVLGRVSIYSYNVGEMGWDLAQTIKRVKEKEMPYYNYGYSTALSDASSGSMFLVVGSPVFNYPVDTGTLDYFEASGSLVSASIHGAAYVYDIERLERNPKIGNVFYKNGQIVITSDDANYQTIMTGTGSRGFSLEYKGTHTIYEHEYLVNVSPSEFNYSTNPASLAQYPTVFDVNQDGVFDMQDIDLILRFLNKQRFYTATDTDDNGYVLEQDTLKDESWWNNDILQTESEDVLYLETLAGVAGTAVTTFDDILTEGIYDYIKSNLIDTGIMDIDGNGIIDILDGALLLNYYLNTLNEAKLATLITTDSTRRYYKDIKNHIDVYSGNRKSDIDVNFSSYIESSSFDPTGSYLAPYITTIGLYNNAGQLLMVGKLGNPIKNLIDWPVNIIVRFDT